MNEWSEFREPLHSQFAKRLSSLTAYADFILTLTVIHGIISISNKINGALDWWILVPLTYTHSIVWNGEKKSIRFNQTNCIFLLFISTRLDLYSFFFWEALITCVRNKVFWRTTHERIAASPRTTVTSSLEADLRTFGRLPNTLATWCSRTVHRAPEKLRPAMGGRKRRRQQEQQPPSAWWSGPAVAYW